MEKETKAVRDAVIVILVMALALGIFKAKMMSDAYNRVTGASTSWWDAFRIDLRIVDSPMPNKANNTPMSLDDLLKPAEVSTDLKEFCHVRLRRTYWSDRRGIHQRLSLTILRRLGGDWIEEDWRNIGAMDVFLAITNLHTLKDGIYRIVGCNEKRDWESGMIEEYDYKLIEIKQ
jgi:hypothetical protein